MPRRRQQKQRPSLPRAAPVVPPSEGVVAVPSWKWFLLSAALPLVFLASKRNLDLWDDEIYTVTKFVAKGPWQIVTDYAAPNNHVFYSLVLWPFYLTGDSNFAL